MTRCEAIEPFLYITQVDIDYIDSLLGILLFYILFAKGFIELENVFLDGLLELIQNDT